MNVYSIYKVEIDGYDNCFFVARNFRGVIEMAKEEFEEDAFNNILTLMWVGKVQALESDYE